MLHSVSFYLMLYRTLDTTTSLSSFRIRENAVWLYIEDIVYIKLHSSTNERCTIDRFLFKVRRTMLANWQRFVTVHLLLSSAPVTIWPSCFTQTVPSQEEDFVCSTYLVRVSTTVFMHTWWPKECEVQKKAHQWWEKHNFTTETYQVRHFCLSVPCSL